jgi:hypothetical protein
MKRLLAVLACVVALFPSFVSAQSMSQVSRELSSLFVTSGILREKEDSTSREVIFQKVRFDGCVAYLEKTWVTPGHDTYHLRSFTQLGTDRQRKGTWLVRYAKLPMVDYLGEPEHVHWTASSPDYRWTNERKASVHGYHVADVAAGERAVALLNRAMELCQDSRQVLPEALAVKPAPLSPKLQTGLSRTPSVEEARAFLLAYRKLYDSTPQTGQSGYRGVHTTTVDSINGCNIHVVDAFSKACAFEGRQVTWTGDRHDCAYDLTRLSGPGAAWFYLDGDTETVIPVGDKQQLRVQLDAPTFTLSLVGTKTYIGNCSFNGKPMRLSQKYDIGVRKLEEIESVGIALKTLLVTCAGR